MSINDDVTRLIRSEIKALSAYHVPEPGNYIKLDAMENPYVWPTAMTDAWLETLRDAELNRYPDPQARELSEYLHNAMDVPEDMSILLGNGSDEIIQMLMMAIAEPGRKVLSVEPSFVMYRMIAKFCNMDYVGVPLDDDFELDKAAMLTAIAEHDPAIIFLAYPNNPTGNLFDEATIDEITNASSGLVIIDEAYAPFASRSYMSRLGEFDRLLVMRTVSKQGLAGLRLGLLAGPALWLEEFDKVRLPYNINILTQISATFALRNQHIFELQAEQICLQREWLLAELAKFKQLTIYPSEANFILLRTAEGEADKAFTGLKDNGILIKNLSPVGGVLTDCLRITVGSEAENQQLISVLKKLL